MKIPLSPRLRACCDFVAKGDRVADVGTDHGYLGIWLLQQGIASFVIASDIAPGPLSAARRNADKFSFSDKMAFYLSDGVCDIPRDFDTLVCAGMGADTMISILEAAPWLRQGNYRLVLQCQSKIAMLRRYLSENGWHIRKEKLLRDGRFLYTVMEVLWQEGYTLTPGQWYLPPALLKNPSPELPEYCARILNNLRRTITGHGTHADPTLIAALSELENDPRLERLKEEYYGNC